MKATCHCGTVELDITLANGLTDISQCNCSFCSGRRAAVVTVWVEKLRIVRGQDHLTLYQLGSKTAKHYFCKTCRIYTYHQKRLNSNEIGVNIATTEGLHPQDFESIPWVEGMNYPSEMRS